MQKQFSVEIHNRFNALPDVNEAVAEKYEQIKINIEVMEELILKVDKKKIPTIKGAASARGMRSSQRSPKSISSKPI